MSLDDMLINDILPWIIKLDKPFSPSKGETLDIVYNIVYNVAELHSTRVLS